MKEGDSLDLLRSSLLYRLWKRQRDGNGNPATAADLHTALRSEEFRTGLELRSVKRALERLRADGYVECAQVPHTSKQPGPAPTGFKIAPHPDVITRRSTAQILVPLHHHPRRPVIEQVFVAEILKMDISRDDTGAALTVEDVQNQLQWCLSKGYVRLAESSDDPENPGGQRCLCTTSKVDAELLFLEKLCGRKGPVRVSSKAVESVDQAVGT